ncbi:MAG: hypothetical protein J6J74_02810 [Elusimicrobiaceae bacterium]|nr:hypothetical protein [Elusimicrobiaceae bacterium]MBP3513408.1 hypothetical protein [Elusimicrobiaceae bacterium]
MKKLFVTLMALTVLGGVAFAQSGSQAARAAKVARAAKDAQAEVEAKKAEVRSLLKDFRGSVEKRTEFNGSFILQSMTGLMDSYIALAKVSESAAVSLNEEINQPIQAGWGRTVTVAQLVRDNIQHVFPGTSTANDFDRFEFLLSKKPSVPVRVQKTVAAAPQRSNEEAKADSDNAVLAKAASAKSKKMAANILSDFQRLRQNWAALTVFGDNQMMTMYFEAERIMEKHLVLKEVDLPLAEALCPLVGAPVKTGYGMSSMYDILFNHAVEMNPGSLEMQDRTENYAKWISGSK